MKKLKLLIFGAVLLECGVVGFGLWVNACTNLVNPGARSSVLPYLGETDGAVALLFLAMAIVGLVVAIKGLKEE